MRNTNFLSATYQHKRYKGQRNPRFVKSFFIPAERGTDFLLTTSFWPVVERQIFENHSNARLR